MGRRIAMIRVPADAELSWLLCSAEAALGRTSAYREGTGGTGAQDYERKVTDKRFGLGPVTCGEATRARTVGARFNRLAPHHQGVLSLAYGVSASQYRSQVIEATNLEGWHGLERAFGQAAGIGLMLVAGVGNDTRKPRRRQSWDQLAKGGAWRSADGLRFIELCRRGGDELVELQRAAGAAIADALKAWWATHDERVA